MRYSTAFILVSIALAISACDEFPGSLKAKAHEAVRNSMFDPEAAKFRNDEASDDGRSMCGEVNGKNRMGAYVGFARYVYLGAGISFVSPGDPDWQQYYRDIENQFSSHDAIEKMSAACLFVTEWTTTCSSDRKNELANYDRLCKLWSSGADGSEMLKKELGITSTYQ